MTAPTPNGTPLPVRHCPGWIRFSSLDTINKVVAKGGFDLTERDMGVADVMEDMDQREYSWRKPSAYGLTLKGRVKAAIRCMALSIAEWASR